MKTKRAAAKQADAKQVETAKDVDADAQISTDDIAAKFTELKDELEFATGAAKGAASKVGVVAGVALVIVAFLLGSRRGKRNKTVVEVRRF